MQEKCQHASIKVCSLKQTQNICDYAVFNSQASHAIQPGRSCHGTVEVGLVVKVT